MLVSAMDRTEDFRQAMKSVKKAERVLNPEGNVSSTLNLHGRQKRNSEFNSKAKEIVHSITKLRDFLLQHKAAYINSHQVVGLPSATMTDHERDKIDEEAQNIIKKCKEAIAVMQQEFLQNVTSEQMCTHRTLVLTLIQNYLKSVCKVYSEQRAIRVKLVVDKKRISRLHNPETHRRTMLPRSEEGTRPGASFVSENPAPVIQNKYAYNDSDDELSEEDEAVLQQENALLFNDMNSMIDEVRVIEGKVVEIARLQEIFSEQVLQQEGDINIISEKVVESTENIKDGNEEIREAIKNNAGFRVWILFFLVMCSFSLLFLEWYS